MPIPVSCTMLTKCIRNCNWLFCLYFLQLQAIILCLFLSVYFLFSFSMAGDERKRNQRNPKGPPKPCIVSASHHNMDITKWKESDMKMCLDEYKRQLEATNNIKELMNRVEIARMFGISPSPLHHRVSLSKSSHWVNKWQHASRDLTNPVSLNFGCLQRCHTKPVCHIPLQLVITLIT